MLTVLDLFSGIGGISLGLEATGGFKTRWFCEIEAFPRLVLAKHWPGVPIFEDVRTLSAKSLGGLRPDCIVGGFPCQDISVAGKGVGIHGHRSGLWSEFARLVGELRPRWVIAENVGALRTRGVDRVCSDLEGEGYAVWPLLVGAWAVGAPHRRERVWIVAHRDGNGCQRNGAGDISSGMGTIEYRVQGAESEAGRTSAQSSRNGSLGTSELDNSDARRRGREGDEVRAGRDEPERTASGVGQADPYQWGRAQHGRGKELGDAERGGRQAGQPQRAWTGATLPSGETRWPARPGEPQHEWEEPRLVAYAKGVGRPGEGSGRVGQEQGTGAPDHGPRGAGAYGAAVAEPGRREVGGRTGAAAEPRSPELPLGSAVDGLPERLVRAAERRARRANREALKAYGNSVVPAVVHAIGQAILAVEASVTAPHAGEGER